MRKLCMRIHRWLAIPLGVFISLICFTGAIMVFQDEIANYILGEEYSHDVPFFMAVRQLHRFLFDVPADARSGYTVGRVIVLLAAMGMSLILLTGIVIWWPRNKEMLRNRLTIHFNKGWRRLVYDSHVSLGIYALVFLLLMSLTGPVFSAWKPYRQAALAITNRQENPLQGDALKAEEATWENPHVDFNHHEGVNPTQFFFMSWHTGRWGGLVTRIIYFLAAIIGGLLPWSGYYMWWKKRGARKKQNQNLQKSRL
jgi:uncharacterized iron-regulated membrane protein